MTIHDHALFQSTTNVHPAHDGHQTDQKIVLVRKHLSELIELFSGQTPFCGWSWSVMLQPRLLLQHQRVGDPNRSFLSNLSLN